MSEVERIKPNDVTWEKLAWPLIGIPNRPDWKKRVYREEINSELRKRHTPYLGTSQCDGCPHKDCFRWSNNTTQKIAELAEFEARWRGEQFLTSIRKPLPEALQEMKEKRSSSAPLDICENGFCFQ